MNLPCNNQLNMAAILNQHPRSAGERYRTKIWSRGLGKGRGETLRGGPGISGYSMIVIPL